MVQRNRYKLPKLTRHASGQAQLRVTDSDGKRRWFYLGHWPENQSEPPIEAQIKRLEILQSLTKGQDPSKSATKEEAPLPDDLTTTEFLVHYLVWAKGYYNSRHVDNLDRCFRLIVAKFPRTAAKEITLIHLRQIQSDLVALERTRQGINGTIKRILEVFKGGASLGLLPGTVYSDLKVIRHLRKGRTTAPESPPIEPITPEQFELILNNLGSQVLKDMARLQWLTGCRPGEIIRMTWSHIDQTGTVWRFQPAEHKTAHLGHQRTIAIGPQGQEILSRYLSKKFQPDLPIFSPKDATSEINQGKRASRKTKVQPSQVSRAKLDPLTTPGDFYDTHSYTRALSRAGEKAGIRMSGNRIRKGRGDEIAHKMDITYAASMLGHRSAVVTEIHYATKARESKLMELAARLG